MWPNGLAGPYISLAGTLVPKSVKLSPNKMLTFGHIMEALVSWLGLDPIS
jgi:hypothetical protein